MSGRINAKSEAPASTDLHVPLVRKQPDLAEPMPQPVQPKTWRQRLAEGLTRNKTPLELENVDEPKAEPTKKERAKQVLASVWDGAKYVKKRLTLETMKNAGTNLTEGALNKLQEQGRATANSLLLASVSQDILNLTALLKKVKTSPDKLTAEDILTIQGLLNTLRTSQTLKKEERQHLRTLRQLLNSEGGLAGLDQNLDICIHDLTQVIHREQGALLSAAKFLRNVLLHPEKGMLKEANIQLTTAEDSVLRNALMVLSQALFGARAQEFAEGGIAGGLSQVAKEMTGEVIQDGLRQAKFTAQDILKDGLARGKLAASDVIEDGLSQAKYTAHDVMKDGLAQAKYTASEIVEDSLMQAKLTVHDVLKNGLKQAQLAASAVIQDGLSQAKQATSEIVEDGLAQGRLAASKIVQDSLAQAERLTSKIVADSLMQAKTAASEVLEDGLTQARQAASKIVEDSLKQAKLTVSEVVEDGLAQAKRAASDVVEDGLLQARLAASKIIEDSLMQAKFTVSDVLKDALLQAKRAASEAVEDGLQQGKLAVGKIVEDSLAQAELAVSKIVEDSLKQAKLAVREVLNDGLTQADEFVSLTLAKGKLAAGEVVQATLTQAKQTLEEASDIILKKLDLAAEMLLKKADPYVAHLDHMPSIWFDDLMNKLKKEMGALDQADGDGAAQAGAIGGFLGSIGGFFKQMLSKGMSALSKEALGAFSSIVVSFMQKVEDQIDPEFAEQKASLQALIQDINAKKETDGLTLTDLKGFYDRLIKITDTMNINFNGIYLPHAGDEEEREVVADAYDHVETLNSAHDEGDTTAATPVQRNWEDETFKESNTLITNVVHFYALEYINEKIRHKQPDRVGYITKMQNAKQLNAKSLERMVYDEIKQDKSTPWYSAWWQIVCAWFVFRIAYGVVQGFVRRASDSFLKETFEFIKEQKGKHFEDFTNRRITDASNYLSVLHSAFKSIEKTDTDDYGSKKTMIKREMENPLRNHFQTVGQVHEEFVQNVVQKGGNRTIAWIVGKVLNKKQNWMGHAMSKMMAAMHDSNGYSDALNTVIIELLENVEKSMKKAASANAAAPKKPMSKDRKDALADLLRNLFQVLDHTGAKKGVHSFLDVLKTNLEKALGISIDKIIIDEMIDNSTFIVADALEMLAQEDQLQMMTYKFIHLLNQSYELGNKEPSPKEKDNRELRVQQLSTNILRQSISQAIDDRADVIKEQKEVNQTVAELQELVNGWYARALPALQALEGMEENDLNSLEARTKIGALYEEMKQFQTELHQRKGTIQNNAWQKVNKDVVIKRFKDVEVASDALVHMIKNVERREFLLGKHASLALKLQRVKDLASLDDQDSSARKMRQQELREVEAMLTHPQMAKDLGLMLNPEQAALPNHLLKQFDEYVKAMRIMDRIDEQKTLLHSVFEGDNSWINQIIDAKRKQPSTVKRRLKDLELQITSTLPAEKQRLFIEMLSALANTRVQADETRQKGQIIQVCQKALIEADAASALSQERIDSHSQSIIDAVDQTGLLDPNYIATQNAEIENELHDGVASVEEFRARCLEILKKVPFVNVNLINPKTLKKYGKQIVFDTTQQYVKELTHIVGKEEILPSAIRHLVMMPYNRYQKEKRVGYPIGYDDHAPAYKKIS